MKDSPQTWHYGLVAQWWAEFNEGGPEVPYFQRLIERYGQPALDVGCGTGRLLLPYRRAGLDVDGSDISPDMLALCQQRADREGLSVSLYSQPMHELDLPRKYKTILVSGAFEMSGDRHHALDALRRFYDHLEPGGVLALDHHVGYVGDAAGPWHHWLQHGSQGFPKPWPPRGEGRRGSDGSVYFLRTRLVDLDPLEQVVTRQIRIELQRDGVQVANEEYTLKERMFSKNEMLTMLEHTGYRDVAVQGDYTEAEATSEHGALVFLAKK